MHGSTNTTLYMELGMWNPYEWTKFNVLGVEVWRREKPSTRFTREYVIKGEVSELECKHLQTEMGYHPSGYGFYQYTLTKKGDGTVYTYWSSSNNCD